MLLLAGRPDPLSHLNCTVYHNIPQQPCRGQYYDIVRTALTSYSQLTEPYILPGKTAAMALQQTLSS